MEPWELAATVGEEIQTPEELKAIFNLGRQPIVYDGFEPSGRLHIAQGLLKAVNIKTLLDAGCHYKIWVADWFAQMNHKFGSDLNAIQLCGRYFIECWRAVLADVGAVTISGHLPGTSVEEREKADVEIIWTSDAILADSETYWRLVRSVTQFASLNRVFRCTQIMGRKEGDSLSMSQCFYPCMQCADVYYLKADICQLGLDQRKVNMLAREYCPAFNTEHPEAPRAKPVIISHHMLSGLLEGQEKMSKSNPDSAIFMDDTAADVERKLKNAYCPIETDKIAKNPLIEYVQYIILRHPKFAGSGFVVGDKTFKDAGALREAVVAGDVLPEELVAGVTRDINNLLEPVRQHFASDEKITLKSGEELTLSELRQRVNALRTTR